MTPETLENVPEDLSEFDPSTVTTAIRERSQHALGEMTALSGKWRATRLAYRGTLTAHRNLTSRQTGAPHTRVGSTDGQSVDP